MAYSRLQKLIEALGPPIINTLPDGVDLKTAVQAISEGLIESDSLFSRHTKYRLTALGASRKSLFASSS
jgi:hypothetical protein